MFAAVLKTTHARTCSSGILGCAELGPALRTTTRRAPKIVSALHAQSELLAFAADLRVKQDQEEQAGIGDEPDDVHH